MINKKIALSLIVSAILAASLAVICFAANELTVTDFGIDAGTTGIVQMLDVSKYVSGGTKPYSYSVKSNGPDDDLMDKSICIDSQTGVLTFTRNKATKNVNKILLTVTDANDIQVQKEFTVGKVTQPEDYKTYPVYVGGIQVSSTNMKNVLGDNKIQYTPESEEKCAVLTIYSTQITSGGKYQTDDTWNVDAPLYTEQDLEIDLESDLTLCVSNSNSVGETAGTYSKYSLVANGGCSVTVTGFGTLRAPDNIYMENGIFTIKGGVVKGGFIDAGNYGIKYCGGDLTVWGCYENECFTCIDFDESLDEEKYFYIEGSYSTTGENPFYLTAAQTIDRYVNSQNYENALSYIKVAGKTPVSFYNVGFEPDEIDTEKSEVKVSAFVSGIYNDVFNNGTNSYSMTTSAYKLTGDGHFVKNTGKFIEGEKYCICPDSSYETFVKTFVYDLISYKYYVKPENITFRNSAFSSEKICFVAQKPAITSVKLLGNRITETNKNDIFGDGSAQYIPDTNTLVFKKSIDADALNDSGNSIFVYNYANDAQKLNILIKKECSQIKFNSLHNLTYLFLGNEFDIKAEGNIKFDTNYTFLNCNNADISCAGSLTIVNSDTDNSVPLISAMAVNIEAGKNVTMESKVGLISTLQKLTIDCNGDFMSYCGGSSPAFIGNNIDISAVGKVYVCTEKQIVSNGVFNINKSASVEILSKNSMTFSNKFSAVSSGDITLTSAKSMVGSLGTLKGKNIRIVCATESPAIISQNTRLECESLDLINNGSGIVSNYGFKFINAYDSYTVNKLKRSSAESQTVNGTDREYTFEDENFEYGSVIIRTHNHSYTAKVTKNATCTENGEKLFTCSCGESYTQTVAMKSHLYKTATTCATFTKDGKVQNKCSVCGKVKSTTAVAKIKSVVLAKTSTVYSGKAQKIAVTVKDGKGKTIDARYYTVTYKNNTNVGKATVTVKFKDNYSGTKTLNFNILPKGTSISKATSTKKSVASVTVKKQATQTTGYEIQYSISKAFKSAKTVKITKNSTTSAAISKLTSGKIYYVRVRTYKTVSKTNYYSAWSTAKTVKIK